MATSADERLPLPIRLWRVIVWATLAYGTVPNPGVAHDAEEVSASAQLLLDSSDGADWPAYGRTYGEQHYSPLEGINAQNISELGLAWFLDLPRGNTVTQPLAVDGALYFTVGNSVVHGVDAVSGKELWVFDPKANEAAGMRLRTSWGSRGLGYWNGKIYTATVDGRLIALSAKTGKEVWSQQTLQSGDLRYITGAPRAFDGKVIIGHGGADSADIRGYVTTYDAETGRQIWRFYLVPGNPKAGADGAASDSVMPMAAATWAGQWWKYGGGGNAWNSFTYDRETDTLLVGTGNGAPWNRKIRSEGKGDNLFLCSVVALDAKTGRYKWHYQVNPGETWDYNAAMDMHLADLTLNGKPYKTVVTAPKNGFLYVIDRTSGRLLAAQKIAHVTWADRIDLTTGRPVENPDARFPDGKSFELWPSVQGAHGALPSAFSPKTRLIYIPLVEHGIVLDDRGVDPSTWRRAPGGMYDFGVNLSFQLADSSPKPGSVLLAWNPETGTAAWKRPTPMLWNGGLMVTGGNLVFQGQADGKFNAYNAETGKPLWSFAAHGAVLAPPITYSVKGTQYVTVLTGMGLTPAGNASALPERFNYRTQARRVLTFALGADSKLPPPITQEFIPVSDLAYKPDPVAARRGALAFYRCLVCHGAGADAGGGLAPDLRTSEAVLSANTFEAIVQHGVLVPNGMPEFAELSAADLADLRQYIRQQAAELRQTRKRDSDPRLGPE